jgi:hypothetical protein
MINRAELLGGQVKKGSKYVGNRGTDGEGLDLDRSVEKKLKVDG